MIELCTEETPYEVMMARKDFARVTGQKLIDPPYWFKHTETGDLFRSLYGCIAWPGVITEHNDQLNGYAAVIAVLKTKDKEPIFKVVDEVEHHSADILVKKCLDMRENWGFGVHASLFQFWTGDYLRFETVVARINTDMVERYGKDAKPFIIAPPDDHDHPQAFDIFYRTLKSVVSTDNKRLYLGDATILKTNIISFTRDNPAVTAVGGLMHTLITRTPWMDPITPSVFQIPEY